MYRVAPVEEWLLDLGKSTRPGPDVARRLLRMLIGISKRTGHTLSLDDRQIRHAIAYSARQGLMADVTIACERCGVQAKLIDWEILGAMGIDQHRECIVQAAREGSLPVYGYLLQCRPGTNTRQSAPTGGQSR